MTQHPFEAAGLGQAPFKVRGWERRVGPERFVKNGVEMMAGAPGQPMGSCDFCGTGISICITVESADGKRFVVGSECVLRTHQECDEVVAQVKKVRAEVRRARQAEVRRARLAEVRLAEQARREEWARQEEERASARRQAAEQVNGEILAMLARADRGTSGFISSMRQRLTEVPVGELSDRAVEAIADICGKTAGRRGSKAYTAVYDSVVGAAQSGRSQSGR